MESLWSKAWLVDTAIAITLLEWLVLTAYHRLTGRGLDPRTFQWNLTSGLCLMLALRCALQDLTWFWGAGFLAASGLAHLNHMRQRLQRKRETRQAFLA